MKDLIHQLYNGFLRFMPLRKYEIIKSGQKEKFPLVGFLDSEKKKKLEESLGITIINVEFFEQALIHRSYLQVVEDPEILSNERLEFLGDAVLGMIVADYLFSLHTNVLEGELTKMRSWLVNKDSLAYCANKLNLEDFIQLSYSAEKSLKKGSESIMADAMEAIIAAIYMDSGLDIARLFVTNTLIPMMTSGRIMKDNNFKSLLMEKAQAVGKPTPVYKVIEVKGPDHDKEFTVAVFIDEDRLASGKGKSKKQAEQVAAKKALEKEYFLENNHG